MGLKYQDVLKFYMNPDIVNSPRPVISDSEAILIKCSMMIIFSKVFQFCENSGFSGWCSSGANDERTDKVRRV